MAQPSPKPSPLRLSPDALRRLVKLQPGRTTARVALEVALIASAMMLFSTTLHWATYPLVALFIASRQHALLVLMHECAHRRASDSRLWNDILGEAIAWPMLMTMRGYRRHHNAHHVAENLNTLRDPDFARKQNASWKFPMKRSTLRRMLLRDLFLLNTLELVQEARDAKNNHIETRADAWVMAGRIAFMVASVIALSVWGAWSGYFLLWLLPTLTFLKAIFRIRSIVDHFGLKSVELTEQTRTVLAPWWERFLIAPCNIGVHHVHHAYAAIPYYRLKEAHAVMSANADYRARVRVSKSYLSALLHECAPGEVDSLRTTRLVTERQLLAYQAATKRQVGVAFPMAYLKSAAVYGLVNGRGELFGGYLLSQGVVPRCLEQLPTEHRVRVVKQLGGRVSGLLEANGVWLSPSVRALSPVLSFWWSLAANAWSTGRPVTVFAYQVNAPGLDRLYRSATLLYSGPVKGLEGMSGPAREHVGMASTWRMMAAFLNMRWLGRRLLRCLPRRDAGHSVTDVLVTVP